jgi:hypothetical protein
VLFGNVVEGAPLLQGNSLVTSPGMLNNIVVGGIH